MIEKRRFLRVIYNAPATIFQQGEHWDSEIRDVSLHGLLLLRPKNWKITDNKLYNVAFSLQDCDMVLEVETTLVHHCERYLRMEIEFIDIDSMRHLKRIVELHVGNSELLQRELKLLSDIHL